MMNVISVFFAAVASLLTTATVFALSPTEHVGTRLLREQGASVVLLMSPNQASGCTGFAVEAPSGRSFVLTNAHCAKLAYNGLLLAYSRGGKCEDINLVTVSQTSDLALFSQAPGIKPLHVIKDLDVYTHLNVIGHPNLRDNTYSDGFIIEGELDISKPYPYINAYYTSALVDRGSSGSPVMNDRGLVVGVVFAVETANHYSYIVPLNEVQDFLRNF